MNLVNLVKKNYFSKFAKDFPDFKAGDDVAVSVRISEGDKSRIQLFEGTVIAIKGNKNNIEGHFRVRKNSSGIGVERIFPYHSPKVEAIKVLKRGKTRRAKLYFLRDRTGKAARIETDYSQKAQAKRNS